MEGDESQKLAARSAPMSGVNRPHSTRSGFLNTSTFGTDVDYFPRASLDQTGTVLFISNEAPPQTDEVYWFLAENRRCRRSARADRFAPWRLCVRSIRHAVCDARDAIFDQRYVEVDEHPQAFVRQP